MRTSTTMTLAVAALLVVRVSAALAIEGYTYTDLGSSFYACGINDVGQVVGINGTGGNRHVFLYSAGEIQDLGTLTGCTYLNPCGIDSAGQVVGSCDGGDGFSHGFLYSGGQMQLLPPNAGGRQNAAFAINDAGQIAGYSEVYYDHVNSISHACVYSGTGMCDLGTLTGNTYDSSYAYAINGLGQVVGSSYSGGGQRAALFSNGHVQGLGTLPGDLESCAMGINNAGQIVGWSEDGEGYEHAFLYSGGQMQYLGTLPGCTWSEACGINSGGQIVGWCGNRTTTSSSSGQAFLYSDGQMLDLGALMGFPYAQALAINDAGQIVGCGYDANGQEHGFLLTPVPEPCSAALIVLGGLALLRRGSGYAG